MIQTLVYLRDRLAVCRRNDLVKVWLFTTIWWALIFVAANYALARLGTVRLADIERTGAHSFLMPFFNFDAGWYWGIATQGYGHSVWSMLAFYPLYPELTKVVHEVFHLNVLMAGFFLNYLATCIAAVVLYLLTLDLTKGAKEKAWNTVALFLFFPTSFFLVAFYTEALFCALSFSAFYLARKRKWLYSCLLVALLTAVRLPGLIVALAVAVEYFDSIGWRLRAIGREALLLLLMPLGFLAYGWLLLRQTGDFFGMIHAYQSGMWDYQKFNLNIVATLYQEVRFVLSTLYHHVQGWEPIFFNAAVPLVFWIGFLAIVVAAYRKLPVSYVVLVAMSLLVFVINGNLVSVNRYVLPLFPVFIVAGSWLQSRPRAFSLVLAGSSLWLGIFLFLFANGIWVA